MVFWKNAAAAFSSGAWHVLQVPGNNKNIKLVVSHNGKPFVDAKFPSTERFNAVSYDQKQHSIVWYFRNLLIDRNVVYNMAAIIIFSNIYSCCNSCRNLNCEFSFDHELELSTAGISTLGTCQDRATSVQVKGKLILKPSTSWYCVLIRLSSMLLFSMVLSYLFCRISLCLMLKKTKCLLSLITWRMRRTCIFQMLVVWNTTYQSAEFFTTIPGLMSLHHG